MLCYAMEALDPMGRIVHFGATYSYGGANDGLRKWLTLVPGYLTRPMVDPGKASHRDSNSHSHSIA